MQVVFVAGALWPRANTQGAAACLGFGLMAGLLRLALELGLLLRWPQVPSNAVMAALRDSNFLHFAAGLGGACALLLAGVSIYYGDPPARGGRRGGGGAGGAGEAAGMVARARATAGVASESVTVGGGAGEGAGLGGPTGEVEMQASSCAMQPQDSSGPHAPSAMGQVSASDVAGAQSGALAPVAMGRQEPGADRDSAEEREGSLEGLALLSAEEAEEADEGAGVADGGWRSRANRPGQERDEMKALTSACSGGLVAILLAIYVAFR